MCIEASRVTNPPCCSSPMPALRAFRPQSLQKARRRNTESRDRQKTMEGRMTQAKTEPRGRILNGRVAVVTGAARGIGRAVAVALASSGANVVGIDICAVVDPRSGVEPATRAELDQTGDMVKSEGVQWKSFVLDQRDLPALRKTAETINAEFGHIG